MALTDENMVMPVQPVNYGGGYNMGYSMPVAPVYGGGFGGGFGNGDWSWIIVLFLFALMGGGFGNGFGGFGGDGAFPWLLNGQAGINANTNAGFDNAAIGSQLSGIQTSITSGFGNAEVASCNRAMDAMQTAYNNQIASMNQSFANSQSLDNRLFDMQMAQQQCCCDNRAGIADLRYTIATEACADRSAVSEALRDVIAANTASTQRVLDQMCQDKIDAKNDTIAQLRQELLYARGQASQDVQTARILQGQTAEVDALYDRLSNCPVPSTPVYGRQPIFTCPQNNCGCAGYNGLV